MLKRPSPRSSRSSARWKKKVRSYWLAAEVMMSSSKIIKSDQIDADTLSEFNFMPIGRLAFSEPADGAVGFIPYDPPDMVTGFVPMELFGSSQNSVEIDDQLLLEQDAPLEP